MNFGMTGSRKPRSSGRTTTSDAIGHGEPGDLRHPRRRPTGEETAADRNEEEHEDRSPHERLVPEQRRRRVLHGGVAQCGLDVRSQERGAERRSGKRGKRTDCRPPRPIRAATADHRHERGGHAEKDEWQRNEPGRAEVGHVPGGMLRSVPGCEAVQRRQRALVKRLELAALEAVIGKVPLDEEVTHLLRGHDESHGYGCRGEDRGRKPPRRQAAEPRQREAHRAEPETAEDGADRHSEREIKDGAAEDGGLGQPDGFGEDAEPGVVGVVGDTHDPVDEEADQARDRLVVGGNAADQPDGARAGRHDDRNRLNDGRSRGRLGRLVVAWLRLVASRLGSSCEGSERSLERRRRPRRYHDSFATARP